MPGSPARPFGASEPAATGARTAVTAVITVIDAAAVTVAIVAAIGLPRPSCRRDHHDRRDCRYHCAAGRGRHERAARTARGSGVGSSTTNHDESGNSCCSGEGGLSGTAAILNIIKMMELSI